MISAGITIEEYELLPDRLVRRTELVEGRIVDVSGNAPYHNCLRDSLVALLLPAFEDKHLGIVISEQGFDFDGNAHGPDVSFIRADKMHLLDLDRRVQRFVPDLAIEIVSRNDTFDSLVTKASRYRKCGTEEVWILAARTRQAFVLSSNRQAILDEDQVFESALLPGFSIRLGDLFDKV